MGWLVAMRVRELVARYPRLPCPVDIEQLAADQGCEIIEWPFLGPVTEVKRGKWIGVALGLTVPERRFLIAHALGHDMLHCGNQLAFRLWRDLERRRQDREADEFAARVFVPDDELVNMIGLPSREMAECFGVPDELVVRRFTEFAPSCPALPRLYVAQFGLTP